MSRHGRGTVVAWALAWPRALAWAILGLPWALLGPLLGHPLGICGASWGVKRRPVTIMHVKNSPHYHHRRPILVGRYSMMIPFPEKPICWRNGRVFQISSRVSRRNVISVSVAVVVGSQSQSQSQSLVVRATGKKNNNKNKKNSNSSSSSSGNGNHSIPQGDGAKGYNSSSERNKSNDNASLKSHHHQALDWREFRAARSLCSREEIGSHNQDGAQLESKPLGQKWAHPISSPETGCVLVATEKLDGISTFERTVILLLRSGTRHPQEEPFGVVINRPLHKRIRHMKPTNIDLATTFANCTLHFGGALEASMFLLKMWGKSQLPGFEEVIPGLCFGARNSLDEAAGMVKTGVLKPQDFKFFVGYAGWQLDQLREEIESDYWYVAACSANLIFGGSTNSSSKGLMEEILQLMGGHYSELSRKPKQKDL